MLIDLLVVSYGVRFEVILDRLLWLTNVSGETGTMMRPKCACELV